MAEADYYKMLDEILCGQFVIIHYPESIYKLAIQKGQAPEKVVSWVYNSNTGKQHRDIAFFNIKPDFSKVRQPYKNPNDKRIAERLRGGGRRCEVIRLVGNQSSKKRQQGKDRTPVPNAVRSYDKYYRHTSRRLHNS